MTTNEKVLVLKHNIKSITKIIKTGTRIQYRLKNDPVIYHGHIQQLQSDSFIINDNAVFLSSLQMIHGKPVSLAIVKGMGIILVVVGTFILCMGIFALHSKHTSGLPFPDTILSIVGIVMIYFGLAGDLLGLIPFFITTRIYDLEKDWNVRIGTRPKKPFLFKKKQIRLI